jgi:acetamidase/formamidase
MKVIDKSVYAFSKNNAPVETADAGEILVFKSMDCFSNKLEREDQLMSEILYGYDVANPAAGPVYINGAEVGDVLVVDQQLFVSLEIEHLGAVECIGSHGVHLIGKHRVDADIATVLEVNTQEVLGVGLFGNLPTDIEQ